MTAGERAEWKAKSDRSEQKLKNVKGSETLLTKVPCRIARRNIINYIN